MNCSAQVSSWENPKKPCPAMWWLVWAACSLNAVAGRWKRMPPSLEIAALRNFWMGAALGVVTTAAVRLEQSCTRL